METASPILPEDENQDVEGGEPIKPFEKRIAHLSYQPDKLDREEPDEFVPPTWKLWLMRGLAFVAFAAAGYLSWAKLAHGTLVGCDETGAGCSAVLQSAWSLWLGIPVSVPAVAIFATLLVVLAFAGPASPTPLRSLATSLAIFLSSLAALAALWFIGIQIFVLRDFCFWCLAVHIMAILMAIVSLTLIEPAFQIPWKSWGAALCMSGVLIGGQFVDVDQPSTLALDIIRPQSTEIPLRMTTAQSSSSEIADGASSNTIIDPYTSNRVVQFSEMFEYSPAIPDVRPMIAPPAVESDSIESDAPPPPLPPSAAPTSENPNEYIFRVPPPAESSATKPTPNETTSPPQEGSPEIEKPRPSAALTQVANATLPAKPNRSVEVRRPTFDDLFAEISSENVTRTSSQNTEPLKERHIRILGGAAEINTFDVPILGSPTAPHVVVKLFDYSCPHCRTMHKHLAAARERYGDQLAIVLMPVPMNPKCNVYIKGHSPQSEDSCDLARLAIGVWSINPAKFPEFDDWLNAAPRTAKEAQAQAEKLVDAHQLKANLADWRINDRIQFGVKLYKACDLGLIPKLILPRVVVRGQVQDTTELFDILEREYKMQPAVATK